MTAQLCLGSCSAKICCNFLLLFSHDGCFGDLYACRVDKCDTFAAKYRSGLTLSFAHMILEHSK